MTWHHPREVFGETICLACASDNPHGIGTWGGVNQGYAPAVETPGEESRPLRGLSARHFIAPGRARAERGASASSQERLNAPRDFV